MALSGEFWAFISLYFLHFFLDCFLTFFRIILLATITIYFFVGRVVYANRRRFRELSGSASGNVGPFSMPEPEPPASKTTEVHITTSEAPVEDNNRPFDTNISVKIAPYAVKIESSRVRMPNEQGQQAQSIADRAAWAYLKCAMLFFVALLITWVRFPFLHRAFLLSLQIC
jgi:hypothetical protein